MASSSAQIFYLPTGCNCDNKTSYGQSEIKSAALEALSLASQKRTVGNDKYPHAYNDDEHFDFSHAQAPWSFPLRKLGHVIVCSAKAVFSPSADRVVLGSIAEDYSSAVYCAQRCQ
ncbi:hypothetical protein AOQ84DRAFT_302460 [Glonium stellatum]|uniref:ribonuclease T1 n=1 Tax=Glonium stellatum TaxID=574774 RepID=A0A8E2JNE5_9PEZI|nr:hypothetical protein AOQ84DRAFT_302460 [Glonium stellatum]